MAKYLQIFMIWTTLSVSMLIVHGSTGSASQIKTLTYDCKPNGTMDITVPDNHALQIIGNSGCTSSTNGSDHIVLTNCKNKKQIIAVRHNKLLGGKMPIFSLLCEDLKYTITLNAREMINISSPTSIPTKVNHTNEITMAIKKGGNGVTSAVIGDKLSLVISAPKDFQIVPKDCIANGYAIWNASSTPKCNVEESVIEANWNINNQTDKVEYSIVMYAFRLVSSDSVKISCTVEVCPSGVSGCTTVCVNDPPSPSGRKRRNAVPLNSEKVNRRLETNLRVYDSVEDKIQASGASVLTTSYVAVFCALVSTLYHSQL